MLVVDIFCSNWIYFAIALFPDVDDFGCFSRQTFVTLEGSQSHQNPRRNNLGTSLRSWDPHPLVIIHCVVSSSGRVVMMNRCRGGNMEWIYVKINSFGCNINLFCDVMLLYLYIILAPVSTKSMGSQLPGSGTSPPWDRTSPTAATWQRLLRQVVPGFLGDLV